MLKPHNMQQLAIDNINVHSVQSPLSICMQQKVHIHIAHGSASDQVMTDPNGQEWSS